MVRVQGSADLLQGRAELLVVEREDQSLGQDSYDCHDEMVLLQENAELELHEVVGEEDCLGQDGFHWYDELLLKMELHACYQREQIDQVLI